MEVTHFYVNSDQGSFALRTNQTFEKWEKVGLSVLV